MNMDHGKFDETRGNQGSRPSVESPLAKLLNRH